MTAGPARARISLRLGNRTVDVAVPAGVPLSEALRAVDLELDAPQQSVVSSTGAVVDPYSTSGDALADGAVLHILDRSRGARRTGAARSVREVTQARPTASPWWLGVAGAAAVVLATTVGLEAADGVAALSGRARAVLALVLLGSALALALAHRRPGVFGSGWPTVVSAVAAFAGGAVTVTPTLPGATQLMILTGLVAATVVVAVRWAVNRRLSAAAADLPSILLVIGVVASATCAVTLLAGLPGAFAAAALFGMVPLGLRVLPTLCMDVPAEQLLDIGHVARTVAVVRGVRSEPLGAVNDRRVERSVHSAERRRDAGTVVLSLLAPATAPLMLAAAAPGTLTGWAAIVAGVFVAAVLALAPRTTRGLLLRWFPRGCAVVVLLELGAHALAAGAGRALVGTAAAVAVGLLIAAVSLPIGRGWRSVGLSRLADAAESLATVLALPVALVAGGAIEAFRQIASG